MLVVLIDWVEKMKSGQGSDMIKETRKFTLATSVVVVLEGNIERIMYVFTSPQQNAGKIKTQNK
jgi:hypothetical protein